MTPTAPTREGLRFVVMDDGTRLDAWLGTAYRGRYGTQVVATGHDMLRAALGAGPRPILLCGLRDANDDPVAPILRCIKASFALVPIVVHCTRETETAREIRELVLAGADELVFGEIHSPYQLRIAVDRALQVRGVECLRQAMLPHLLPGIASIFDFALTYPRRATSVEGVAAALGVHRKTLVARCRRVGAVPPGRVIQWARILAAGQAIGIHPGSVEAVANDLEFASATALRNLIRRYSGMRPRDIRASGGLERLLTACQMELTVVADGRRP